jgi:hypothetical protein
MGIRAVSDEKQSQMPVGVLSEVQTISCRRHPRRSQANPLADKPQDKHSAAISAHFVR